MNFFIIQQQTNGCQSFDEGFALVHAFLSNRLDVGVDFALPSGHALVEVGLQLVDVLLGVSFPL